MPMKLKLLKVMTLGMGLILAGCVSSPPSQDEQTVLTEERVVALIEERLASRAGSAVDEAELDRRIEQGIVAFVEKQRQAQARAQAEAQERSLRPVSAQSDHILGNPKARFSLIEYSDTECPFCKRFHATAHQLVEDYEGEVNWVYRHFPLESHNPGAQKQAEASECAAELGGNQAFWRYLDAIFARTSSGGTGFPLDKLVPLAGELGLDERAFQNCLESERYAAKVQQQLQDGLAAGVNGTPGNFLVDHTTGRIVPIMGARPLEAFKQVIDQLSKQSAQ
jgi:protein-disulfide isomerase